MLELELTMKLGVQLSERVRVFQNSSFMKTVYFFLIWKEMNDEKILILNCLHNDTIMIRPNINLYCNRMLQICVILKPPERNSFKLNLICKFNYESLTQLLRSSVLANQQCSSESHLKTETTVYFTSVIKSDIECSGHKT